MKFLLLLAFIAVGQSALLGSDRCTYGPSYWCSHIRHANDCGAMQHCMDNNWKKQLIGATETCFDVVKILNTVRQSRESDMLEKLAMGCTGLSGDKRTECKQLMLHTKGAVLQLLKSDLSSGNIALALGLCGGSHHIITGRITPSPDSATCADCKELFADMKKLLLDSEGQLKETLDMLVCSKLGTFKVTCEELLDKYVTSIVDQIASNIIPEDICDLLTLCNTTKTNPHSLKSLVGKHLKSNASCGLCMSFAKDLQDTLRNPTLQNDVVNLLETNVCPLLPASLAAECKTYVSQYGPLVFQVLVAELDPSTICQTIGLCNATKVTSKAAEKLSRVLLQPAGIVQILPEQPKPAVSGVNCVICEFVMTKLETFINSKSTKADIEDALEKVCSLLPSTITSECDAFVTKYSELILNLLLQKETPSKICAQLGLCTGAKAQPEKTDVTLKSAEVCTVCEEVMNYVKIALDNPAVDKEFDSLLEGACIALPAVYQATCKLLVEKYGPALINLLKQYDDPLTICTDLHLCPAATESLPNDTLRPSQPLKFQPMMDLQKAARRPHLLGDKQCTFGPSYWCATLENARECNAEKLCREHYGKTFD